MEALMCYRPLILHKTPSDSLRLAAHQTHRPHLQASHLEEVGEASEVVQKNALRWQDTNEGQSHCDEPSHP